MGCASSHAAVAPTPPTPSKAAVVPEKDFHLEYALKEKLGEGAFGALYAARHTQSGNDQLSVKVVDLRDASSKGVDFDDKKMRVDRRRQRSVLQEVAMLSALSGHRNVCQISECFIQGGLAYIVLEAYDRTLCEALEGCPRLNEETLRPFFRGMLTGIEAIHALRIVHRDIKPDSFRCSGRRNTVKLCDFSLACTLERQGAKCAERTAVYGSAIVMAPEVVKNEGYGAKVDVWSFGVVVHLLLRGRYPYKPQEIRSTSRKASKSAGMSEVSKSFVAKTLSCSAKRRPTSQMALQDEFFKSQALSQTCLRQMLEAAQLCGAFGDTDVTKAKVGDVDVRLRHLQDRPVEPARAIKSSPPSEVSTEIGSSLGEFGELPKGDHVKPSGFHSSGALYDDNMVARLSGPAPPAH